VSQISFSVLVCFPTAKQQLSRRLPIVLSIGYFSFLPQRTAFSECWQHCINITPYFAPLQYPILAPALEIVTRHSLRDSPRAGHSSLAQTVVRMRH